jgi:hypothetical protein
MSTGTALETFDGDRPAELKQVEVDPDAQRTKVFARYLVPQDSGAGPFAFADLDPDVLAKHVPNWSTLSHLEIWVDTRVNPKGNTITTFRLRSTDPKIKAQKGEPFYIWVSNGHVNPILV